MNSNNNPKRMGLILLQRLQVLYQNKAVSNAEKNEIATLITEGTTKGTFYKVNAKLFDILETTPHPHLIDETIQLITF